MKNNYKTWTLHENNLVQKYYKAHGPKWCANLLNRSYESIKKKAKALSLTNPKPYIKWSQQEEEFLINHYKKDGINWCCIQLHRSKRALYDKANKLNLKTDFNSNKHIGKQINNWTIIGKDQNNIRWNCRCKCGFEKIVESISILSKYKRCIKCAAKFKTVYTVGEIPSSYWIKIIDGAKRRDLDFNITLEYVWCLFIYQQRKCNISGKLITFAKDYSHDFLQQTASLDRIDSAKGYIIENVQWIHKDINKMKHAFPQEYFIQTCKEIAKY